MKNTYYFPHDYHSRQDPKIAALIKNFGLSGYGLWWSLIELLHEQGGKLEKFPKLYEGLAHELKQNEAEMKQFISSAINDFNLLKEDETHIWSERVMSNIEDMEYKRSVKAEAGRLGGIKSGESRRQAKQNEAPLEANEQKESKVKESKRSLDYSYIDNVNNIKNLIKLHGDKHVVKKILEGMGFYEYRIIEAFEKAGVEK